MIAHCVGDLISKNFFGYVSYNLNWYVLPKTIGEIAAQPSEVRKCDVPSIALDYGERLDRKTQFILLWINDGEGATVHKTSKRH